MGCESYSVIKTESKDTTECKRLFPFAVIELNDWDLIGWESLLVLSLKEID